MRVLVLGGSGMLARDLLQQAPPSWRVQALTHGDLDITDHEALDNVFSESPDLVINAAGYTAVDAAERFRDVAYATNGHALRTIGEAAAKSGTPILHFSSDYVFNGKHSGSYTEHSAVDPLSTYGRSKLLGEQLLSRSGAPHLIIRTQWLFGSGGSNFVSTMLQRALGGTRTRIVGDQFGRPTYTRDLALGTWKLVGHWLRGANVHIASESPLRLTDNSVINVANSGTATWFELAKHIFSIVGNKELLTECSTADFPTAAIRPRRAVLDTTLYQQIVGGPLPHWEDAVRDYLACELSEAAH